MDFADMLNLVRGQQGAQTIPLPQNIPPVGIPIPITPGNIDLNNRPVVRNPDGSVSTVQSTSFQNDLGQEVLVPAVADNGTVMSPIQAWQQYEKTGNHLGIFPDAQQATQFAQQLHQQQADQYLPKAQGLADVINPQPQPQSQSQQPRQASTHEQRVAGWAGLMDKLKDPSVAGPLQTFLLTMSAPYGYGESFSSRLGRAVALGQLHRNMLQQNAADKPRQDALQKAELDKAQAAATSAQADARLKTSNANLADSTFDLKIAALQQDLDNAAAQGRLADANLSLANLKTALMQKYGAKEAEAKLALIRAQTFRENSLGQQAKTVGAQEDKVWQRQVSQAKGLVQGTIQQFKLTNPGATKEDFYKWLDDQKWTNPDLGKVHEAVGILMGENIDPFKDFASAPQQTGSQSGPIDAATIRARLKADQDKQRQKLDHGRNPQFQGDPNKYYPSIWDQ